MGRRYTTGIQCFSTGLLWDDGPGQIITTFLYMQIFIYHCSGQNNNAAKFSFRANNFRFKKYRLKRNYPLLKTIKWECKTIVSFNA